jgi:hypothetical protein
MAIKEDQTRTASTPARPAARATSAVLTAAPVVAVGPWLKGSRVLVPVLAAVVESTMIELPSLLVEDSSAVDVLSSAVEVRVDLADRVLVGSSVKDKSSSLEVGEDDEKSSSDEVENTSNVVSAVAHSKWPYDCPSVWV